MKVCRVCGVEKDLDAFHKCAGSKDGYQRMCKSCSSAYRKAYYKTAHGRSLEIDNGRRSRDRIKRKVIEVLSSMSCVDCGESDVIVLDFDHRDPAEKSFTIAQAVVRGLAWSKIISEMEKCDVRCANCHRRRTAAQFDWMKSREVIDGVWPNR